MLGTVREHLLGAWPLAALLIIAAGAGSAGAACAGSGVCPPSVSEKQPRWWRCAATAVASAALPRGTSLAPRLRHPELCRQHPSVCRGGAGAVTAWAPHAPHTLLALLLPSPGPSGWGADALWHPRRVAGGVN